MKLRIGHGYDIHRLVPGRKCILGGVEIPFELGLDGHSDADSLTHAICDALLGAGGFADIGNQFPNTDERYRDIDSQKLLKEVLLLLRKEGFRIVNIDSTVIAERPKLQKVIPAMRRRLSETLELSESLIGIKATTNEETGSLGRGEAIAAHAVCLIAQE
ncbi:MAG TPA: 2-C-methyl-D-erythritol 2,4-cyclodiphosphate synthase [Opitutales bacterium]|nr:2-C-methyl-D-erythritol 2,4-cyclodiphosphate synthase [Opitutales bacterium]